MIDNPCNKCKWYSKCCDFDYCDCGEYIDDECYGCVWKFKYTGDLKQQRKECQGKDFVPRKSLFRWVMDLFKGGSK